MLLIEFTRLKSGFCHCWAGLIAILNVDLASGGWLAADRDMVSWVMPNDGLRVKNVGKSMVL